jgi:hypothetical protein
MTSTRIQNSPQNKIVFNIRTEPRPPASKEARRPAQHVPVWVWRFAAASVPAGALFAGFAWTTGNGRVMGLTIGPTPGAIVTSRAIPESGATSPSSVTLASDSNPGNVDQADAIAVSKIFPIGGFSRSCQRTATGLRMTVDVGPSITDTSYGGCCLEFATPVAFATPPMASARVYLERNEGEVHLKFERENSQYQDYIFSDKMQSGAHDLSKVLEFNDPKRVCVVVGGNSSVPAHRTTVLLSKIALSPS